MGCSHNEVTGIREGNSEKLGGVEIRTLRGDATLRKGGGQWCQKLQWSRQRRAEVGLMAVGEGAPQLTSGDWKRQSQRMVWPGAHFKTGLKSLSYGNALFTLIILYQVGVTSCSVWERVGEKGCGDGQVVA